MFRNFKFSTLFLATFIFAIGMVSSTYSHAQRITIDQFLLLERQEQREVIANIRKFIVETDILQSTNPQEFKNRQVLLRLWSNIIRKAHAEDYDLYANSEKIKNGESKYCMFAGWMSLMYSGKCAHPKNLQFLSNDPTAKALFDKYDKHFQKVKSQCGSKKIICNPLVFGVIDHCAPGAIPDSQNASLSCWKAHEEQDKKLKKIDPNKNIDDSIIDLLIKDGESLKEFTALLNRTYSMCLCKGYQVKDGKLKPLINYKYSNRMFAHRTCTSMISQASHFLKRLDEVTSVCTTVSYQPQIGKIDELINKLQSKIDTDYERRLTAKGPKISMEQYYNAVKDQNGFALVETKYQQKRGVEVADSDKILNDPYCKLDYIKPPTNKPEIKITDVKKVEEASEVFFHVTYKIINKDGEHNELDGYIVKHSPKADKTGTTANILIYKQLDTPIFPKVQLYDKSDKFIDEDSTKLDGSTAVTASLKLEKIETGNGLTEKQVQINYKVLEKGEQKDDWKDRYKVVASAKFPAPLQDADKQSDIYEKQESESYIATYTLVEKSSNKDIDVKKEDIGQFISQTQGLKLIASLFDSEYPNYPKEKWQGVTLEIFDGTQNIEWSAATEIKINIDSKYTVEHKIDDTNTDKKVKIIFHERFTEDYPVKYEVPNGQDGKEVKPAEVTIPSDGSNVVDDFVITAKFVDDSLEDDLGEEIKVLPIELSFSYKGASLTASEINLDDIELKLFDSDDNEITEKHVAVKDKDKFLLDATRVKDVYFFEAHGKYKDIEAKSTRLKIEKLSGEEDPDDLSYSIKELKKEFDETTKKFKLVAVVINKDGEEVDSLEDSWTLKWTNTYTEDDGDDDTEDEEVTDDVGSSFEIELMKMDYEQTVTVKLLKGDEDKDSESTLLDANEKDDDDTDDTYTPKSNKNPKLIQPINPPPLPGKQKLFLRGKY